ncbi:MAG: hypothetical protein ACLR17_08105 [Enterobacteriaceae bacterium]
MGIGGDDSWTPSVLQQWLLLETQWQYQLTIHFTQSGASPQPLQA